MEFSINRIRWIKISHLEESEFQMNRSMTIFIIQGTGKMDLTELKRMEATKFNLGFIFYNLSFHFPSKKDLFNEKGRISAFYLLFAFVHRISFRYISIQEDIRRIQFLNIHDSEAKGQQQFFFAEKLGCFFGRWRFQWAGFEPLHTQASLASSPVILNKSSLKKIELGWVLTTKFLDLV